jgi:glycosyltransferase involved in cell wall biosynthesis
MYSGNAGVAHRFDEVLAAMKRLDGHPHIRFVFVGEGPRKKQIQHFVDQEGLSNFRYLPYFPKEQLKYSLSLADVHLLTLRNDMAGIAVPNKLYGIMAARRPVLMVGPEASEPGETIQRHQAGQVVDPSRAGNASNAVQALYTTLLHFYSDDKTCSRFGENGRAAFLDQYEREVASQKWHRLLVGLVQEKETVRKDVATAHSTMFQ